MFDKRHSYVEATKHGAMYRSKHMINYPSPRVVESVDKMFGQALLEFSRKCADSKGPFKDQDVDEVLLDLIYDQYPTTRLETLVVHSKELLPADDGDDGVWWVYHVTFTDDDGAEERDFFV
jgi:hypothetical protein